MGEPANGREFAEAVDGALTAVLMPVLLHKLSNATQLLSSLNALLSIEGGAELALSRTNDMARTSSQVEDLGWLLAALASASGADLLLERRERRGLAIFSKALQEALRRRGCELLVEPATLPDISREALDGWELPWVLCSLVLASAGPTSRAAPLVLHFEAGTGTGRAEFDLQGAEVPPQPAQRLLLRLPGAEFLARPNGWVLAVPARWLHAPDPNRAGT